ncbi:RNA polymerase sigma factor [Nocardiopsis ganjiahuensis]|uniref:RNA polymerase sigma factor n=1 Tax=Nocardiopsis ganjiahuensis TaxID=239984 RepID=UPI00035D0281|nr:sigma-70 family RNA polymerase sigma factor [Nocardiopsis ganjiahuensis]
MLVADACWRSQPESRVLFQEDGRRLLEALQKLPQAHREAFVMRSDEGFSYAEIAQVTGRQESTVRQHHRRALEALQRLLRE